eukprot:CAMPEP_0183361708 /NCGR_PEP_ID=MMETSP0164_2-20130417/63475_1 /TAXON_ID=221442 /ORGANISM="Coccolithus pelagicus ssp braarudi, Strain PLY182g" /LENGTH=49 /DNA_ID= /DNA_START= /DNA_END= /DNA_ORIENTATION=
MDKVDDEELPCTGTAAGDTKKKKRKKKKAGNDPAAAQSTGTAEAVPAKP